MPKIMEIGKKSFEIEKHTYVMGILNVTPDSFSDGGKFFQKEKALKHVRRMIEEGVDLIDVGGESTRPGYQQITDEEEIRRIASVITSIKTEFDIPISVDTYKPSVAESALEAGADLINDIWGLKYDAKMAEVIAEWGAPCCLMHNRSHMDYGNFMEDMKSDLQDTLSIAQSAGILEDKIILDPGIGFGKTYENNLEAIYKLEELKELGFPLLLGTSRKSVIGHALNAPVEERIEGTLATTVFAVLNQCAFVRVHDIKENKRVILMTEAIREGWMNGRQEI